LKEPAAYFIGHLYGFSNVLLASLLPAAGGVAGFEAATGNAGTAARRPAPANRGNRSRARYA
jgi:hypothetical protein